MLKLATTPQEHDAATNNNEGKTHPVPTTHTPSTNYADNRYQQPLFRTQFQIDNPATLASVMQRIDDLEQRLRELDSEKFPGEEDTPGDATPGDKR